jgi:predicted metal-dependent phosphotriesterase family hydrolase
MSVDTVRGPVDSRALGGTLMHDNVFLLDPAMLRRAQIDEILVRNPQRFFDPEVSDR